MIVGDPYKFSVMVDRVKEWNVTEEDKNGYLNLAINGILVSYETINANLLTALYDIKEALKKIPFNDHIFSLKSVNAINELYELVYPSDEKVDNEYDYLLSVTELVDAGIFVFAVKQNNEIRIISGKGKYDFENSNRIFNSSEINEIIINNIELDQIIREIELILSK